MSDPPLRRRSAALLCAGHLSTSAREPQSDSRPRLPASSGDRWCRRTFGIVAASQPLAARAGVQILERGGNAIDAAIAANATIGLMEPTGNGLGGDLFIIYYEAKTGTVHGLNSSGWAPTGLTARLPCGEGITEMPQKRHLLGDGAGVVAGWDAMRAEIRHEAVLGAARAGDLLRRERISALGNHRPTGGARSGEDAARAPELAASTYLVDGERAPKAGEIFRNPDLAGSLRLIAEKGRDGYYRGKTAEAIVDHLARAEAAR